MAKKKKSVIKNLSGYVKPLVERSANGVVMSVGMFDGQNYYTYNKPESGLDQKPRMFVESYHKSIGNVHHYLNDMAKLIDEGNIFIKHIEPVKKEVKQHQNQVSLF